MASIETIDNRNINIQLLGGLFVPQYGVSKDNFVLL